MGPGSFYRGEEVLFYQASIRASITKPKAKSTVWGIIFQISRGFKNVGPTKETLKQNLEELKVSRTANLDISWEMSVF